MPAKQESIAFPIRKTRTTRIKSGKSSLQTEREDARSNSNACSDEEIVFMGNFSPTEIIAAKSPACLSPRKASGQRRTSSSTHTTRRSARKKDDCPRSYRETSVSPRKSSRCPTSYRETSVSPRKSSRCPTSYRETSVSPRKSSRCPTSYRETSVSPRKSSRCPTSYRETSVSPRKSSRKKDGPTSYRETSVSPRKKISTIQNREHYTPKKLTYEDESPLEQMSLRKRDCLNSYQETNASPRRPPVGSASPVQDEKFMTPKKLLIRRELPSEVLSPTRHCPGSSSRSTPGKGSRNGDTDPGHQTPTKRKMFSPDVEECLSPSKRVVVVVKRIPKESFDELPCLVCPNFKCQGAACLSPLSRKTEQSAPLSPVLLSSHDKSLNTTDASLPKMEKLHTATTPLKAAVPQTPDRTAQHHPVECHSPPRSVVKRLNMNLNSPMKSPMKPLLLASPRRSPRKLNNENMASPLRGMRKEAQSPLRLNSPSSLVSRLSLASPPSGKRNPAVSLFKPNVAVYRALRQSLNTGTPSVMVCREKQADEIKEFLTHHLTKNRPGSLYISGAPGTGKTASLNSHLETLELKKLKKVFLNCMTIKTAAAIHKTIAMELGLSVSTSEKENRQAIEKLLTTSRQPILLMLDEVDQLDSKNQEVLYTIFEWPALPRSSLVLVGIANSLDLTDRILPRLQALPNSKPKLLHFPPYSKPEIVKIITQRIKEANLGDVQVIRPAAIQLLAGKVAAVAGDVRKALDVCRRAVELCSPQKASKNPAPRMVEIPQILSIFNEVYGSRVVSAVTNAPESFPMQQKILVCCLLLIFKFARSKDVTLGKFHEVYTRVCKKQQVPRMDQTEFLSLCTLLESRGMLQVKRNKEIRSSKVLLLLNAKEAEDALGDRNLLLTILEDRESLGKLCSQLKKS
ncbi:Cell division control protein 6 [Chionoecetes opilio]|uniref:Cell division control protein 6 n=1 Tax=Chionoecetes opilio TaxID=41210 RepID=A0A8J4XUJ1_CHIOP|nr:Cell division control protein 6 [Chionoecetes opilio]